MLTPGIFGVSQGAAYTCYKWVLSLTPSNRTVTLFWSASGFASIGPKHPTSWVTLGASDNGNDWLMSHIPPMTCLVSSLFQYPIMAL